MLPNLKSLRKKAGISQQALADVLGISQQSINQYENHHIEPDIFMLCQLADYFHTSIDFIVGRSVPEQDQDHLIAANISQRESNFLEKYRTLKPNEQQCVSMIVDALLKKD